jgi:hypothetical protein
MFISFPSLQLSPRSFLAGREENVLGVFHVEHYSSLSFALR